MKAKKAMMMEGPMMGTGGMMDMGPMPPVKKAKRKGKKVAKKGKG